MSKLSHSNQETMDELDRRRAIENGDEDLLQQQPTPTPAKFYTASGKQIIAWPRGYESCGIHIAECNTGWIADDETARANAAHIVRCVNLHDELVEILRQIDIYGGIPPDSYEFWASFNAVLAKAKEPG